MKKSLNLFLIFCLVFSFCSYSTIFAVETSTTEVAYIGEGTSEWSLTVPIDMKPGEINNVNLTGMWDSLTTIKVTSDENVTLKNSLDKSTKTLIVDFDGISQIGDNIDEISITQDIGVEQISNVLFGTWTGILNYYLSVEVEPNPYEHNGIIPEGGTYYVGVQKSYNDWSMSYYYPLGEYSTATAIYEAGDEFPTDVNDGDVYVYGDYEYRYNMFYNIPMMGVVTWGKKESQNGWGVRALTNKKDYGIILNNINNKSIVSLNSTFENTDIVISPIIPNTVISMNNTFMNSSLKEPPIIPDNVIYLNSTFSGCRSLTNAPIIPNYVTSLSSTFESCISLIEAPNIPNYVKHMDRTFSGCSSLVNAPIIPTGVISMFCTFEYCESLVLPPIIPESVNDMYKTFHSCTSLVTAPVIPNSVSNLEHTFSYCTSLTGEVEINANPTNYRSAFSRTIKPIILTGTSDLLSELASTSTYDNVTVGN